MEQGCSFSGDEVPYIDYDQLSYSFIYLLFIYVIMQSSYINTHFFPYLCEKYLLVLGTQTRTDMAQYGKKS